MKNLNVVMAENGVPIVNLEGFMANNARANWDAVRHNYGDGDQVSPLLVVSVRVSSTSMLSRIR